jgi:hypothetical protein
VRLQRMQIPHARMGAQAALAPPLPVALPHTARCTLCAARTHGTHAQAALSASGSVSSAPPGWSRASSHADLEDLYR